MKIITLNDLPDLLTPEDAANYLQMSTEYIYKSLRRGTIRGRKLGNKWRIQKSEVIRISHLEEEV